MTRLVFLKGTGMMGDPCRVVPFLSCGSHSESGSFTGSRNGRAIRRL